MKKLIFCTIFLSTCLFSLEIKKPEPVEKKSDAVGIKEEFDKSEKLKKDFSNYLENKDSKKNVLDNLYIGADGTLYGKKIPKVVKVPEIKTEYVKPEDRKMYVDTYNVRKTKEEISKKSLNIANLYEFLSLYGMEPRKDGNLPNEKELYKLIESKKIKLEKSVIRAEEVKK